MGCPFRTPAGALEAVRACVMAYLTPEETEGWTSPRVLVGPQGVGHGYTCCDEGLLVIEWLSTSPKVTTDSVRGDPCQDELAANIRVTLSRCIGLFSNPGGITDGSPPTVADRNGAASAISVEAFGLLEALLCCIHSDSWEDCGVRFVNQDLQPPRGRCWAHSILLRADLVACCN